MPTNFPGDVDTFPTATDLAAINQDDGTEPHTKAHGDLGDAVTAIETYVLSGAATQPGSIYGGNHPYNMSHAASPDDNAVAMERLITDAAALGAKAIIPATGPSSPIQMAPWFVTIAGDRYICIESAGPNNGIVVQQKSAGRTDSHVPGGSVASNAWKIDWDPTGNGDTQSYWSNINGNAAGGSIIVEKIAFQGHHSQKPSPQDAESTWATYGIGFRAGRRVVMRNVLIGGFHKGLQFDGEFDHNHFDKVNSSGNWYNMYFGPESAVKDSTFIACQFASASMASIAIDPKGFLAGSSFYGCHLGTAPYGILAVHGTKAGSGLLMQANLFAETIWEGVGNGRIWCVDGDSWFDRIMFAQAQFHGIEAGDQANASGSQHMFFCSNITALGRANTGIITCDVDDASMLAVGNYITINGDTTTLPPNGPMVNGTRLAVGNADSFMRPYRITGLTPGGGTGGTDRILAQGTCTTVASFDTAATGVVAQIGMFRGGKLTKWKGVTDFNPDEIYSRDNVYGLAAETYVDCDDMDGWDLSDNSNLFHVQTRTTRHLATRWNRMRNNDGGFFLARAAGSIDKTDVVEFNGANGDVIQGTGTREVAGVVGGTGSDSFPSTPAGVYAVSGDMLWVQDDGIATVAGIGGASGGQTAVADTGGAVAALTAGTAPGTSDFKVGKVVAANTVKL